MCQRSKPSSSRWRMDRLERLTLDSFAHYMDLNEAFHLAMIDLAKS